MRASIITADAVLSVATSVESSARPRGLSVRAGGAGLVMHDQVKPLAAAAAAHR